MLHYVNDASFMLPAQFMDRTMHRFVSFDEGAGRYSVVMSQAAVSSGETLAEFADEIVTGLAKAMPDFSLLASTERMLGDTPAIELAYHWRRRFRWLLQRQVLILVPGAQQGERESLLITATCDREFAQTWHPIFETVIGSFKLRDRTGPAPIATPVAVVPSIDASVVFALCASRRTLHAFASRDQACSSTDAYEVQAGAWRFFDAVGRPIRVKFAKPRAWWRVPGRYALEAQPEQGMPSLREQLQRAEKLQSHPGSVEFASIAELHNMFDQLAKE